MKYWRFSMKDETTGNDIFPYCKTSGIAVIDFFYWNQFQRRRVSEDCRLLSDDQYRQQWRSRAPRNFTGKYSLWALWKEMKVGDLIYAKSGPWIVGKGLMVSEYSFDPEISKGCKGPNWGHFVRVKWNEEFSAFSFRFRDPRFAIREIKEQELNRLLRVEKAQQKKATNK